MIFSAELGQLHAILSWVVEEAEKAGITTPAIHKIELACEEVVVNIIHHAYGDAPGHTLEIECERPKPKCLEITVRDRGKPFNPLDRERPANLTAPASQRKIGGLGIYFVQEVMDNVSYHRDGNANVLKLVKDESRVHSR